ncbi:hypothetical protein D3C73_1168930 [compost metagenome]
MGGLKEEQAAGQALGHGVVDFSRNALAFGGDSGFTLLGGELLLGLGDVVEKPALQCRVAFNLVVDQREQGARREGPEQHGDVRPVAHPEEADGGSGRRRTARHVARPSPEGRAREEEDGEGTPGEARSDHHQRGPCCH